MQMKFKNYRLVCSGPYLSQDSMILGFLGPPSSSGQGLCVFNGGPSLVVKLRVKNLATPDRPKLDLKN